jgi:hypothetical protein
MPHMQISHASLSAAAPGCSHGQRTLLVTGLHGRKCRFGMLRYTDSTSGTLRSKIYTFFGLRKLLPSCMTRKLHGPIEVQDHTQ